MSSSVRGVSSSIDADDDDDDDDLCTHMHDAYARAAACLSFKEINTGEGDGYTAAKPWKPKS